MINFLRGGIIALLLLCSIQVNSQVVPTKGTDFWMGFMDNYEDSYEELIILVTSDVNTSGTLSIPLQGYSQSFTVSANQTTQLTVPFTMGEPTTSEVFEDKGIHIETDDLVSVFALNFVEYTADGSKILPTNSLGTDYRISAYEGLNSSLPSEFVIVGTEDNTEVTITPTAATLGGKPAGVPFTITIDQGELYQVKASSSSGDFTGTKITGTDASGSCRTFAVFSGTKCTNIPSGCTACDHIYDQNLPIYTWGTTYYAVPWRNDGERYAIRVVADEDNTSFTVNGGAPINLSAGQFWEDNTIDYAACIVGNKKISVTQYMTGSSCTGTGDPVMVNLNPESQKIDNVTFSTVPGTVIASHHISIIMETASVGQLLMDGSPVNPTLFTPFSSCPFYSYTQFSISAGSHTLEAADGLTAYIYGTGNYESYAYSAGSFFESQVITVDTVVCTQDTVDLVALEPLVNAWWSTASNPTDTIGTGMTLTVIPTASEIYIVRGQNFLSGCEEEFFFNVDIPNGPTIGITSSTDTVCIFQQVDLQVTASPQGFYNYSWTPNIDINDPTIADPTVTPSASRWYYCTVSTGSGCSPDVVDSVYVHTIAGDVSSFVADGTPDGLCLGDTTQLNVVTESITLQDDFDPGVDGSLWSFHNGTANSDCGSVSGNALYFNSSGSRRAETIDLNVSSGGTIRFKLKVGTGSFPCDDADFGEDIAIEYSTNAGSNWDPIVTLYEFFYPVFTDVEITIPVAAQTASTRFRVVQVSNSGVNQDNWAIDDFIIGVENTGGYNYTWSPAYNISSTTSATPYAFPASDTAYVVTMTDPGSGCSYADTVSVGVGQPFTISVTPDTVMCDASGIPLSANPSAGTGHSWSWSPSTGLSSSQSPNPTATPTNSTTYSVTVTSDKSCVDTGSVTITVSNLATLEITPTSGQICIGDSVQVDAQLDFSTCGLTGATCSSAEDSIHIGTSFSSSSSSWLTPFAGSFNSSKRQYIITQAEMNAAGLTGPSLLKQLSFNVASVFGDPIYDDFTISMTCTNLSEFPSTSFQTGLDLVFNPKSVTITSGWNHLDFDNMYSWDGSSNIIIEVCFDNLTTSSNSSVYYTWGGNDVTLYDYGIGSCSETTGSQYDYRPNMQLNYCVGTVTNNLTYNWTPVTGISDPAISNPYLFPTTQTTYTVHAIDTVSGCDYSNNITINAGPLFNLDAGNDTMRCDIDGVQLTVQDDAGVTLAYDWSPGIYVDDSTIYNPKAIPNTTTQYIVEATSVLGCTVEDTITVNFSGISDFYVTPSTADLCLSESVQAVTAFEKACGVNGTTCGGAGDSVVVGILASSTSSTTRTPFTGFYASSRRQYIITAAELNALGMSGYSTLTGLAFNVSFVSGSNTYDDFTIKMACTSNDFFPSSTFETNLQTVHNPKTVVIGTGWVDMTFDNNFDWDGVSNLLVEVCYNNIATSSNSSVYYTYAGSNMVLYAYGTGSCTTTTGSFYSYRPDMKLNYCDGNVPNNLVYTWSPVAGVSDINASDPLLTPTTSTTYTVLAVDTVDGCEYSDQIVVNVAPDFNITVSDDTVRCAAAGVPIDVQHTSGSSVTFNWSPGTLVTDSTIANPLALPDANTQYVIEVTSLLGCTKTDSVNVLYGGERSFGIVPDSALICSGETAQVEAILDPACGVNGNNCTGATDSIFIGTGTGASTSTGITPFTGNYSSSRRQYIITQAELNAQGINGPATLSALGFNVSFVSGNTSYDDFTIKMACTTLDEFSSGTFETGLQTVFNPQTINLTSGWNNFQFNNGFDWDGTTNIIIETCYDNITPLGSSSVFYTYDGIYRTAYEYGTNTCTDPVGTRYFYRPNMQLKHCAPPPGNDLVYVWNTSTGMNDSTIYNPELSPVLNTTFDVLVTDTSNGCSYTDSVYVGVGQDFTIDVTDDTVRCSLAGVPLEVTHTSGVSVSYSWSPGSSLSDSMIATPLATPDINTQYMIEVSAVDGCSKMDSVNVQTRALSEFTVLPDSTSICTSDTVFVSTTYLRGCGANGSVCAGPQDSLYLGTSTSYTTSVTRTPFAGQYNSSRRQYILTAAELLSGGMADGNTITKLSFNVQAVYGNSTYDNFTIKMGCSNLNAFPNSDFVDNLSTVGNPKTINLQTGWNHFVLDNTFDWDGTSSIIVEVCFDNTTVSSSSAVYYTYSGTNRILYAYGASGTCNTSTGSLYNYRPNMKLNFCSTGTSNDMIYTWSPVIGVSDPAIAEPTLTPTVSTEYYLTLQDTAIGCTFIDTVDVEVNPNNLVLDIMNDTVVCESAGLQLILSHNGGGSAMFSWAPAALLDNATIQNPTILSDVDTSFVVTVSDGLGCGSAMDSVEISLSIPQISAFHADTNICRGDDVQLFADGGISYDWTPGLGLSDSTIANPIASPDMTTKYKLVVTDNIGCQISDSLTIDVTDMPVADLGNDTAICSGEIVTLDADNPGASYSWSTGANSQMITVSTAGTYFVDVVIGGLCTDRDSILVSYLPNPEVDLGNDTLLCDGKSLELNAGTGNYSFSWSTGATSKTITVAASATYWVQATDGNNCSTTDSIDVSFVPYPSFDLGDDTILCFGEIYTLDAMNPGATYSWSTGDTSQTIDVSANGMYYVAVTNGASCTTSDTISISYHLEPTVVNIGNDIKLCQGDSALIDPGNDFDAYIWSTGDTTKSIVVHTAGEVSIIVIDDKGCYAYDTLNVTIYQPPVSQMPEEANTCAGTPVLLDPGDTTATYYWSTGETTPTIYAETSGIYWVNLSSGGVCNVSDTIDVTINASPIVNLGPDRVSCEGSFILADTATGDYLWSTGETTQSIEVEASGTYFLTVTNDAGCSASDTVDISILGLPPVVFDTDTLVCLEGSVTLSVNNVPGATYLWSTGETENSISVSDTGMYAVTIAYEEGCDVSDSVRVVDCDLPMVFPNLITPNGDGKNDFWVIDNLKYHPKHKLMIFNRNGNLVYETDFYNNDWDGTLNGKMLPATSYYYVLTVEGYENPYKGSVTIIREW